MAACYKYNRMYLIEIFHCMQAAEIKDVSQKCKQKQDALELKDKQVRVLIFVTFLVFLC